FVAIPSPGTGAYTGSLIAWFFKLNRRQSFAVIALGVVTAGIMTALIVTGGLNILNFLV
ncbi:small multi-drug export protein, partial [Candidatus Pacearchaeota archaeon]|nr:small multi-drug export protein [Candidatus Pacearchaeota archaeon]